MDIHNTKLLTINNNLVLQYWVVSVVLHSSKYKFEYTCMYVPTAVIIIYGTTTSLCSLISLVGWNYTKIKCLRLS